MRGRLVLAAATLPSVAAPAAAETPALKQTEDQLTAKFQKCLTRQYPQSREELPYLLNCMDLSGSAVEVGVQRALHAVSFLKKWRQGKKLFLVDKWENVAPSTSTGEEVAQKHRAESGSWSFGDTYVDIANVASSSMQKIYEDAVRNLAGSEEAEGRFEILRSWSANAATEFADALVVKKPMSGP